MIAAVFPGQGSQKPGMGKELYEGHDEARRVFEQVASATGIDVAELCFASDEETLRRTQNAQIALFTVSIAAFQVLGVRVPSLVVAAAAGHSVGEYAALVASETLSVETGARLVQKRGQVMARAGEDQPGTMAAVLGLDREPLEAICRQAKGIVVVANDNCPGQLVISGESDAVNEASRLAQEHGAKRVIPLNVSGAFHSPLMQVPAEELATALVVDLFRLSPVQVYANVTAEPALDAERWPKLLEDQLQNPVRWTETVQNMVRDGVQTFIEFGSGEVLCGLIKRVSKDVRTLNVGDETSLARTVQALAA